MTLFADEDRIGELEKFNRKRCLANVIVAEEHMSLEGTIDGETSHPWCARKHVMMSEDHMREAVEHTDREEKEKQYREAREKLNEWVEEEGAVSELRDIRNWLREVFEDTSLNVSSDSSCSVCEKDKLNKETMTKEMRESINKIKSACDVPLEEEKTESLLEKVNDFLDNMYMDIYEKIDEKYGLPEPEDGGEINSAIAKALRTIGNTNEVKFVEGEVKLEEKDPRIGGKEAIHQWVEVKGNIYDFGKDVFTTKDGDVNNIKNYRKTEEIDVSKYDTAKSNELYADIMDESGEMI